MKKVNINGIKFEIDFNLPRTDMVYCVNYDMYGEFTQCDIIDTPKGRQAVNVFDVPFFGIICVGVSEELIFKPMYQEVI